MKSFLFNALFHEYLLEFDMENQVQFLNLVNSEIWIFPGGNSFGHLFSELTSKDFVI